MNLYPSSTTKSYFKPYTLSMAHSIAYSSAAPAKLHYTALPSSFNFWYQFSNLTGSAWYKPVSQAKYQSAICASLCLMVPKLVMGCLNCSRFCILNGSIAGLSCSHPMPLHKVSNGQYSKYWTLYGVLCRFRQYVFYGTLASWKYNWTVEDPLIPIFFSSCPWVNPSVPLSTMKPVNLSPSTLAKRYIHLRNHHW